MNSRFDTKRKSLSTQFTNPNWIPDSGITAEVLEALISEIEQTNTPKDIVKAKTFESIATKAMIAVDTDDIFQDKLMGVGIMAKQRDRWENAVKERHLSSETANIRQAWEEIGRASCRDRV